MAQYWRDFSADALAAFPTGFTDRFGMAAAAVVAHAGGRGGKALALPTTSGRKYMSLDAPGATVQDAYLRYRLVRATNADNTQAGPMARAAGSTNTTNTGYIGHHASSVSTRFRISSYLNGSYLNDASAELPVSSIPVDNEWFFLELQVSGSAVRMRSWPDKPDAVIPAWILDTTNTRITTAGTVGIFHGGTNSYHVDSLAIGTEGDLPPTAPETTPAITRSHADGDGSTDASVRLLTGVGDLIRGHADAAGVVEAVQRSRSILRAIRRTL